MDRLKEGIGTGMIKIAICDDKRIFAKKMQRLIDSYCTKKQILYEADLYQSGYELTADPVKMMSYQIEPVIS